MGIIYVLRVFVLPNIGRLSLSVCLFTQVVYFGLIKQQLITAEWNNLEQTTHTHTHISLTTSSMNGFRSPRQLTSSVASITQYGGQ